MENGPDGRALSQVHGPAVWNTALLCCIVEKKGVLETIMMKCGQGLLCVW
jgi:hypothetical protein